jgi:hypothetical protein
MRNRTLVYLSLGVLLGCTNSAGSADDATGIVSALEITSPADFSAVATSNTYREFFAPSGYWIEQYNVWAAVPPSDTANAGIIVSPSRPVFLSANGVLTRVSAADIGAGDSIEVWRERTIAYGSTSAPPGAPAYSAKQVLIHR